MLVINSAKYNSYLDMCKDYNINYKNFLKYKKDNLEISEMDNRHYITRE